MKLSHLIKADKHQKHQKGEKGKAKKIPTTEKPKDVGHFLVQKLKILISVHARAKML